MLTPGHPRPAHVQTALDMARRDLEAAEEADLGEATADELVRLVERLRGALADVLRAVES